MVVTIMIKNKLEQKVARRQFLSLSSAENDDMDVQEIQNEDINSNLSEAIVEDQNSEAKKDKKTTFKDKVAKKLGLGVAMPSAALVAGCSPDEIIEAVMPLIPTTPPAAPPEPAPGPSPDPSPEPAPGPSPEPAPPPTTASAPANDAEAVNFLTNAQFSASFPEMNRLRSVGYEAWLNAELDKPIGQTAVARLQEIGYEDDSTNTALSTGLAFHNTAWRQLFTADDAVRKRLAFALSQFFVVGRGLRMQFLSTAFAYYWDILNRGVTGNFRDLLEDVTLAPAMGRYLSMHGNRKGDPATGRLPDENFAREILQLFSIGLVELNIDGTSRLDSDGNEILTYSNDDIVNLARVFTGWAFNGVNRTGFANATADYARTPMTYDHTLQFTGINPRRRRNEHSQLEANFLGTTVPANTDAPTSLRIALDAIFAHRNVGPFFCRQMIQRLVTNNPSTGYVRRVARVFNNNGSGVRGDLRSVFIAILTDREAIAAPDVSNPASGKLREPMLRYIQWGRTFGYTSASDEWGIGRIDETRINFGQRVLGADSVFNFFRPGFSPAGTAISDNDLLAPEFQISNEVTNVAYLNFIKETIGNRSNPDLRANYDFEVSIADNASRLVNRINLLLTGNQLSNSTRDKIITAVESVSVAIANPEQALLNRVRIAIFLTMASSDYLIKK